MDWGTGGIQSMTFRKLRKLRNRHVLIKNLVFYFRNRHAPPKWGAVFYSKSRETQEGRFKTKAVCMADVKSLKAQFYNIVFINL
jgi:hypothetical protein